MGDELLHYDELGEIDGAPRRGRHRAGLSARPGQSRSPVIQGTEFEDLDVVEATCEEIRRNDPLHINLLSKCITHKHGYGHILFLGTTDSGKSTCINQVQKDMLWHVGRGYGHRVFIWDYKRTARSYLESLPLKVPLHYLDPPDQRSSGIDWPREIRTRLAALQFTKSVLHAEADPRGHNYAFISNARSALFQVIRVLQLVAPGKWDLTDVVEACSKPQSFWKLLLRTERGRAWKETVFGTPNQGSGVFFSLEELAFNLGPIAAALSKVPRERRITLDDWMKSESVLVLGHFEGYADALAPFQRWVFGKLAGGFLSRPDIPHDGKERTSFFLDEVRNSPFGAQLVKLANSGRSKGAVLVAGVGDISGLRVALGKEETEEFVGMFKTKVFLRCDGTAAEWASQYFGKQLRVVKKFSEGSSVAQAFGYSLTRPEWRFADINLADRRGTETQSYNETRTPSTGVSYEPTERTVLEKGDFRALVPPQREAGMGLVVRAYVAVQEIAFKEEATHMDEQTIHHNPDTVPFVERDEADFDHDEGWGPKDLKRLNLVDAPAPSGGKSESQSPFDRAFAAGQGGGPEVASGARHENEVQGWELARQGVFFDKGEIGERKWDLI